MINIIKRIILFLLILLTVGCANQNILEKQQPQVISYILLDSTWNLEQVKFEISENNQKFSYKNIEYLGSDDFEYDFVDISFYFLPKDTYIETNFLKNYNVNKEIIFSSTEASDFFTKLTNKSFGPASIEGNLFFKIEDIDVNTIYMEVTFRIENGEYRTSLYTIPRVEN